MTIEDTRELLSLMPRALDLVWRRGSGPVQCDEAGETLPMPLLHFAVPLDDGEAVRGFVSRPREIISLAIATGPARRRQADGRHVQRWRRQDNRARRAELGSAGRSIRPVRRTRGWTLAVRLLCKALLRPPADANAGAPPARG